MHRVRQASAQRVQSSLPRKSRPPAIVGWPNVDVVFGNPKAHFSFSAGTCSAVRPGWGWKRVLARSTPQPFQLAAPLGFGRSEEHTSELQSHLNLVCRLLLEKKNINSCTMRT